MGASVLVLLGILQLRLISLIWSAAIQLAYDHNKILLI